jgi:hypothetical protein
MKILEKILALGIAIALIMKFSLIPGGDTFILWTMLTLACLYYPLGFLFLNQVRLRHIFKKDAYRNVTTARIILAVVTGIGLSSIVVGSLFKLLTLPGADNMLFMGLIMTGIALMVSVALSMTRKDAKNKFIFWRVGIIGVVGISLFLTSELSIVKFQYRNHPEYIEAYRNYLDDPGNEELYKKVELERSKIRLTEEEIKGRD